jgi:hypothetical protein
MVSEPRNPKVSDKDKQSIADFVDSAADALGWIFEHIDYLARDGAGELIPDPPTREQRALSAAWIEFNELQSLQRIKDGIFDVDNDDLLWDHGLTGNQLRFKLLIFQSRLEEFNQYVRFADDAAKVEDQITVRETISTHLKRLMIREISRIRRKRGVA